MSGSASVTRTSVNKHSRNECLLYTSIKGTSLCEVPLDRQRLFVNFEDGTKRPITN